MAKAKIYVTSRVVEGLGGGCGYDNPKYRISDCKEKKQHMFIVHENSREEQVVYRGGPSEVEYMHGMLMGDLEIIKAEYKKKGDVDWVRKDWKEKFPLLEVDSGSDEYIASRLEKLEPFIKKINEEKYDYKLSITDHQQNSNTAVRLMIEEMGYEFQLPRFIGVDGKERKIDAPGYKAVLKKTDLDIQIQKLQKQFDLRKEELTKLRNQELQKIRENLDKAIDDLLKEHQEKFDQWKSGQYEELERACEEEKQAAKAALDARCNEHNADSVTRNEVDGYVHIHYTCKEEFKCSKKLEENLSEEMRENVQKELDSAKKSVMENAFDLMQDIENAFKLEVRTEHEMANLRLKDIVASVANDEILLVGEHGEL